jgi:hypothetical protein
MAKFFTKVRIKNIKIKKKQRKIENTYITIFDF